MSGIAQGGTARAPAGMLCRCPETPWPHRHISEPAKPCFGHGRDIFGNQTKREEWRTLAREDHEAAKAQLLRELFP